ncbi:unnamed protein product [Dimorphilus gyrociliatus]|uniref:Glycosyltransferase family 92 protein n=1 Tax=Dimorphilus gyrociliatus TaxID=2664684 RepID=A0A7I8WCD9_9ANNE|nr:unnamed protein product [Dimorphilus gyrociliatus]
MIQLKQLVCLLSLISLALVGYLFTHLESRISKRRAKEFIFSGETKKLKFQSMKNGEWQTLERGENIIYFHRALYDSRNFSRFSTPSITMYALSNTRDPREVSGVVCTYILRNQTVTEKAKVLLFTTAYRYKETHLQEYVFNCPVSKVYPIPTYIFLKRDNSTATLKIEIPYSGSNAITVCVPFVYGSMDRSMVTEWFEYQRYFGVDAVELAVWQVSNDLLQIFKYYESINFLTLTIIDIPYKIQLDQPSNPLHPSKKPFYLKAFMPIPLNECYLMNSLRSKYVLSLDFDEFIFTNLNKYPKYTDLLKAYDTKPTFVNLIVGRIKVDVTCKENEKTEHFIFQHKYRQRLSEMRYLDNPKSFVNTKNCPFIGNHYCVWRWEKSQKYYPKANKVDAFVAHYRKQKTCGKEVNKYVKDTTIDRIEGKLSEHFNIVKQYFKTKSLLSYS